MYIHMTDMKMNKFMNSLVDQLVEKNGVTKMSAMKYVGDLYRLNGERKFSNLVFLNDVNAIMKKVNAMRSVNTQASYMSSIVGVLNTKKASLKYSKLHAEYKRLYLTIRKALTEQANTHKKSEKEKAYWMSWEDVIEKREELASEITEDESHKTMLDHVVLSLYTYIPPRRNEYVYMWVVDSMEDATDNTRNYFVMNEDKFVFNQYKTKRYLGQQTVDIPDELSVILQNWLETKHPTYEKGTSVRLLVKEDGKPIPEANGITRILNGIFKPKKISSTALRHIYVSDKYGPVIEEKKKDADTMAHSTSQQSNYIKIDKSV